MKLSFLCFWACFAFAFALTGCRSGAPDQRRQEGLAGERWSTTTQSVLPGGVVASRVTVTKPGPEMTFKVRISVFPDHPQDVYFLAPVNPLRMEHPTLLCLGRGQIVATQLGAPDLSHDGLEKLTLLKAGEGYSGTYWIECGNTVEFAKSIRVTLFFISERIPYFRREFAKLEDTGFTWYTEIGSPIWCAYMKHLVPVEVSVSLTGGTGPCERSERRRKKSQSG